MTSVDIGALRPTLSALDHHLVPVLSQKCTPILAHKCTHDASHRVDALLDEAQVFCASACTFRSLGEIYAS
ncbi:hypothetical protein PsYK624_041980 [Phanerochaete sordida]|uniref:Uncharacterized protein n=1 Tax=Phanerochaete sordida TaxID=48140 RepID=A0A9P3G5B5_9APHY|nr:hypothetical protein PsYK624_041980 [Phanerochaete sordida]